jgi:hypothetical protein
MIRNSEVLQSFVEYCTNHPEHRFWQALRNWAGYAFIYAANELSDDGNMADTFFWEGAREVKHERRDEIGEMGKRPGGRKKKESNKKRKRVG